MFVLLVVVPWIIAGKEREKRIETEGKLRFSDRTRVEMLIQAEAESLWPAVPEKIPEMKDWIRDADDLLGRLDTHRRDLHALQARALPYDKKTEVLDRESHSLFRKLRERKEQRRDLLGKIAKSREAGSVAGRSKRASGRGPTNYELRLATAEADIARIEKEVNKRRTWKFENHDDQKLHVLLFKLVSKLDKLADKETGARRRVQERMHFAQTLVEKSTESRRRDWDRAISSIRDPTECPRYNGLVISPQLGLVPLGADPDSGLWEFAHLQTGQVPERGKGGKLDLGEETCVVFVLVPGGTFRMGAERPVPGRPVGAPNVDPEAKDSEGPVHQVTIRPFFLSKYEMTQGQWYRFTGEKPSCYDFSHFPSRPALLYPVEQVSWNDVDRVLSRLNLRLPTEAEWEYAARAGTTTIWWTGNEKVSLTGAANLADRALHRKKCETKVYEDWLDDRYSTHAPVGRFKPNAFGLHDICGNVHEWCQDGSNPDHAGAPTDGSARETGSYRGRVDRGGGYDHIAFKARSASRGVDAADARYPNLGFRPALSLR